MFIVDANILTVGIGSKSEALEELPVRLFVMDTAVQALHCLRSQKQDMVMSQWELPDMPDGVFLRRIMATKSGIPTIAFIRAGDHTQEALARSLGVSAVFNEDIDDEQFREMTCRLLSIYKVEQNEAVDT